METLEQFFDRHASLWDTYQKAHDFETIENVFKKVGVSSSDIVLDVGTGTGVLVPFLVKYGCVKFAAIDISQKMVGEYRKKYPTYGVVCGDYQKPGLFQEGQFSKIIIYNAFPHFSVPSAVFRNSYQQLQKDGLLVIFHSRNREQLNLKHKEVGGIVGNHLLLSDNDFRDGLISAGFQDIVVDDSMFFFASARKRN
jgi:cyclopropane fatty-acyl-phospholipid synthase-like methyltransferase